jgi:hypothetical protein
MPDRVTTAHPIVANRSALCGDPFVMGSLELGVP